MEKTTDLLLFEKGLIVGARLAGTPILKTQTLLGSQKQPYHRFSKIGNRTHSPSLEGVTAFRAQFSKSVIGVASDEFYGRTGTLM